MQLNGQTSLAVDAIDEAIASHQRKIAALTELRAQLQQVDPPKRSRRAATKPAVKVASLSPAARKRVTKVFKSKSKSTKKKRLFTPAQRAAKVAAVKRLNDKGMSILAACQKMNVGENLFYTWRKRQEAGATKAVK